MSKKDELGELMGVRSILISIDPSLDELSRNDPVSAAVVIRNIIYKKTPVVNTWTEIDWANYDHWFYLTLFDDSKGQICLGLAAAYGVALTSFGIDVREVSLFESVSPYSNGHNSVEIWSGEQWIASDPTFDVFFLGNNNKRLSWEEIRNYCKTSGSPSYEYGVGTPLNGRSDIRNYYATPCQLSEYIAFSPSARSDFEILPNTWNGIITYVDESTFDVRPQLTQSLPWKSLKQSRKFR